MAYEFNHYYELQNVATGKYVNVLGNHEDGTVKNGETVNLFNRTNNPDQRWALENYGGNGNVRIVLQRGEGWYALNYNTRNANCIVWHLNTADDIDTVITAVQVESLTDTYYLKLRDRDTYLTADGTALKWVAYTGEKEQMLQFLNPEPAAMVAIVTLALTRLTQSWLPNLSRPTRITILKIAKRRAVPFPKSRFTIVLVF